MKDPLREAIRQKLGDALELPFPKLTPRVAGRRGQSLSTILKNNSTKNLPP